MLLMCAVMERDLYVMVLPMFGVLVRCRSKCRNRIQSGHKPVFEVLLVQAVPLGRMVMPSAAGVYEMYS